MKKYIGAGLLAGAFLACGTPVTVIAGQTPPLSPKDQFVQACMADRTLNVMKDMTHDQPQQYQSPTIVNHSRRGDEESCTVSWEMSDKSGKYVPSRLSQEMDGNTIETPFTEGPVVYVYLKGMDMNTFCPPETVKGTVIMSKSSDDNIIPWKMADGTITKKPYTVDGHPANVRFVCP